MHCSFTRILPALGDSVVSYIAKKKGSEVSKPSSAVYTLNPRPENPVKTLNHTPEGPSTQIVGFQVPKSIL